MGFSQNKPVESSESLNTPKPAKFISEEEYKSAAKISGFNEDSKKPSLHDLLYKDHKIVKPGLAEDFLELEENKQEKGDLLGFDQEKNIDLLEIEKKSLQAEKTKVPENFINSNKPGLLENNFDIFEDPKPNKKLDLLEDFSEKNKNSLIDSFEPITTDSQSLVPAFHPISSK